MKQNILFLLFMIISLISYSQTAEYNKYIDNKLHKYLTYISKSGDIINIGDTLIIGMPSGVKTFNFIQQGMEYCAPNISNKKIKITEIRSYKNTLFIGFNGYGLLRVYAEYENAIASGELRGLGLTSDEALNSLKKSKDKLDLGLITPDQYEKAKADLIKYIK